MTIYGQRAKVVQSNFREVASIAHEVSFPAADGILIDLGLSSDQLEASGRGFSFNRDEPLDMRFDPTKGEPAAQVLASPPISPLARGRPTASPYVRSR